MKHTTVIVIIAVLFFSCGNNKFDVDISKIKADIKFHRLDLDLIKNYPDTPNVYNLMKEYGNFLDLYSYQILKIGGTNQKDYAKLLNDFNQYCFDYELPEKIERQFGDLKHEKQQLDSAFRYYKYYFPEFKIPKIYTYISNFSQSVVIDENVLGIGLDKYLGSKCELYGRLGFDNYKRRRMIPPMIVVDCARACITSEYTYDNSNDNLLNQMVYEGKIQYCMDAILPFVADTLKFGYTGHQLAWAHHNESNMWSYLIDHQYLFSIDALIIKNMIGEGPFTSMFAANSAPRAGAFLGWKIVSKYMNEHPKISLKELMNNKDYQGILNSAKYKP